MLRKHRAVTGAFVALLIAAGTFAGAWAAAKPRVYGVFAKIELTDAQAQKVAKIQTAAREQIKKIEAQADTTIRKLLTEDQRKEIEEIEEAQREKRREYQRKYYQRKKAELEALRKAAEDKKQQEEKAKK